jgi:short-subunit dehydrogenase
LVSSIKRLVLVTGASAGIGAAFARAYAARGWDVALTGRRAERLGVLAGELAERHGIEALALPDDLADPAAPARLLAEIEGRGRRIDGLVNNAGYGLRGPVHVQDPQAQAAMLQVLTGAVVALSRAVLPGMREQGFGRVVNVASVMGLIPGAPEAGLYSGAKAFVVGFSEGLHLETRGSGVHVSCLCPGLTRSEFHAVAGITDEIARAPAWMWMSAEAVAEAGVAAVEAGRALCVPGVANKAVVGLARMLPRGAALALTGRAMRAP